MLEENPEEDPAEMDEICTKLEAVASSHLVTNEQKLKIAAAVAAILSPNPIRLSDDRRSI